MPESKFSSSECKENFIFSAESRENSPLRSNFRAAKLKKSSFFFDESRQDSPKDNFLALFHCRFKNIPYLCQQIDEVMEEKKYPQIDEEEGIGMCCEPMAEAVADTSVQTTKLPDGGTIVHDWIDNLDWDRFPILGPKTEEEAIARIDKFEEDLAKGQVHWISSEDAWNQLYSKYPWLR